jgi:hypothetical protein
MARQPTIDRTVAQDLAERMLFDVYPSYKSFVASVEWVFADPHDCHEGYVLSAILRILDVCIVVAIDVERSTGTVYNHALDEVVVGQYCYSWEDGDWDLMPLQSNQYMAALLQVHAPPESIVGLDE